MAEVDPADSFARALLPAFRADFAERQATAHALAELLLDATEEAIALIAGGEPAPLLRAVELFATRLDLFEWDGPPGWDVVLALGLADRRPQHAVVASPLGGLPAERAAQSRALIERAQREAERLLGLGKAAAAGALPLQLVAAHASLLRLFAIAAAAGPLQLAEDGEASALPPPGEDALVREMTARAQAGSDFSSAQEEWLARLQADNPAAAAPGFRTFFAGISQWLRAGVALLQLRDAARAGRVPADADHEALLGAVGGWQPERWSALRHGAPAAWWSELFPAAPEAADPPAQLARECSAALDVLGRLWAAKAASLTAFTALASAFTARCAAALALYEELAPPPEQG